jgi:hypothetical protein
MSSRGCPYHCHFCHNTEKKISFFSHERTAANIDLLLKQGAKSIFFCDDNFVGNPQHSKELLRTLIPLNNSFKRPVTFSTQLTVSVARMRNYLNFWPMPILVLFSSEPLILKSRSFLSVPEGYTCVALLPLGYADEAPEARARKEIGEIVFKGRYTVLIKGISRLTF